MSDSNSPKVVTAHDIKGNLHEVDTGQLRWRPSTYGILVRDNSVLALPQHGRYDLPGGGVEINETLEQGLQREVKEETGFEVSQPRLVHAVSSYFKMPNVDDDFIHAIMLYYACEIVGGELSDEGFDELEKIHVEMAQWIPIKNLGDIELTSGYDWRPLVHSVATQSGF